jgi:hypothetical protein
MQMRPVAWKPTPSQLGDADPELNAALSHGHRLRLHEAKNVRIAASARACNGIQRIVEPLHSRATSGIR